MTNVGRSGPIEVFNREISVRFDHSFQQHASSPVLGELVLRENFPLPRPACSRGQPLVLVFLRNVYFLHSKVTAVGLAGLKLFL
jgi:hypothetical protein